MLIKITSWVCRIIAAVILGQTLFFKFGGALESQYIFSSLGVEPWGRLFSGVIEAITVVFLLVPSLVHYGALLSVMTMSGAIASHLLILGIEIKGTFQGQAIEGDGGFLFMLSIIAFICSLVVLVIHRQALPYFNKKS